MYFDFDVDHGFFADKLKCMSRDAKQLLATKFATDDRYIDKKPLKVELIARDVAGISFRIATFLPEKVQWRDECLYPEDDMAL